MEDCGVNVAADEAEKKSIRAVCHGSVSRVLDLQNTADTAVAHSRRATKAIFENELASENTFPVRMRECSGRHG